jgi:hypothetical protein
MCDMLEEEVRTCRSRLTLTFSLFVIAPLRIHLMLSTTLAPPAFYTSMHILFLHFSVL